jgi:hypothetical protein
MKRLTLSFLLLLTIAASVSAQSKTNKPTWLNGTWGGTGYQTDTESTWTILLKASGGKFTIEYPSLQCGGTWRSLRMTDWSAEFRETITFNLEDCVNKGTVTILRLNRHQALYRFSYKGTNRVTATGILNRKRR